MGWELNAQAQKSADMEEFLKGDDDYDEGNDQQGLALNLVAAILESNTVGEEPWTVTIRGGDRDGDTGSYLSISVNQHIEPEEVPA